MFTEVPFVEAGEKGFLFALHSRGIMFPACPSVVPFL